MWGSLDGFDIGAKFEGEWGVPVHLIPQTSQDK